MNENKNQLVMYLTDIRDSNYYNPRQGIIRVRNPFRGKEDIFYDFKLAPTFVPPNPKDHKALLITSPEQLTPVGLTSERLEFPPGMEDMMTLAEIKMGIVYLIDKNQRITTVDNQTGSTGFSISKTNMFEDDKVRVSIAPPISKDYTNYSEPDKDSNQIGLFMNNDVVALRSKGAQITLGEEGIHFGGKIYWESTTHSKEFMQDNFIHQLIPSTLPTAAIAIPQLPNFGMISVIAATANKIISVAGKATKITDIVKSLA